MDPSVSSLQRIFPLVATRLAGAATPKAGAVVLEFDFSYDGGVKGGGEMTIRADDNEIGRGRIARTISKLAELPELTDTLDIGFDGDTPVTRDNPVGRAGLAGRAP